MKTLALMTNARSRVFLWWIIAAPLGFVATHFYQRVDILWFWAVIIGMGFAIMHRAVPRDVPPARNLFFIWLIPVAAGMEISAGVYYMSGPWAAYLLAHLGSLWLYGGAIGYLLTSRIDRPGGWYVIGAIISALAATLCLLNQALADVQYIIAAVATAGSLVTLVIFRTTLFNTPSGRRAESRPVPVFVTDDESGPGNR